MKSDEKITLDNFNPDNRERTIGNSHYKICRKENGMWYIHETYNDGASLAMSNGFYNTDLNEVISRLNSFTREGEVFYTHTSMHNSNAALRKG